MPNKEEYAWYKAHHICPVCRKNRSAPNRVECDDCLEKGIEKMYKKRQSLQYQSNCNEYGRTQYQKRKEAGVCTRCGKRKPEAGKSKCFECNAKDRIAHKAMNDKKSRHWKENGLCQWCNNKAIKGKNYCKHHYRVLCEQIADGRKAVMHKTFRKQNNAFWMEYKKEIA